MKKRINAMVALLSVLLLMGSLSACAPSQKPDSKDDNSSLPGTQVSQEFLDSLRGLEVTVVYPWNIGEEDTNSDEYKAQKALEEKYGFKLINKSGASAYVSAMVTSLLAGRPYGNVLMCPEDYLLKWYKAGIMADLTEAASTAGINFTDDRFNQIVRKYTNFNGGQYAFYYGYQVFNSIYYNKRILSENNIEDPYSLQKNGNWTFDTLADAAKKCTKTNPDGTVSLYGLGTWTEHDLMTSLVVANDGSLVDVNSEGAIYLNLKKPQTMEALQYFYDWFNVGNWCNVSLGSWETTMKDFVEGKYAFCLGTSQTLYIAQQQEMQDEFGIIAFPKGPSNTSGNTDYQMGYTSYFVPSFYQKDAAKYLYVMDMVRQATSKDFDESFEEEYLLRIPDETSYENYKERTRNPARYELFNYSGIVWSEPSLSAIVYGLANGTTTPGPIVDGLFTSLDSVLQDNWSGVTITGLVP